MPRYPETLFTINLQLVEFHIMKNQIVGVLIAIIIFAGGSACSLLVQPGPSTSMSVEKSSQAILSKEEQEKKAFQLFEEILNVVQDSAGEESFAKVEKLYLEIINTCPDIGLAQESSWRLFSKYFDQGSPEGKAKAKELYASFIKRYPNSVFREPMARKMGISSNSAKAK